MSASPPPVRRRLPFTPTDPPGTRRPHNFCHGLSWWTHLYINTPTLRPPTVPHTPRAPFGRTFGTPCGFFPFPTENNKSTTTRYGPCTAYSLIVDTTGAHLPTMGHSCYTGIRVLAREVVRGVLCIHVEYVNFPDRKESSHGEGPPTYLRLFFLKVGALNVDRGR